MASLPQLVLAEVDAEALERFIHQPVDNEMISYLAKSAAGVVECDPDMTLPPAAQSEPMYPSTTWTTNRRAMTTTDGGRPTVHDFVRELVASAGLTVPTLMPTLVYLRRIKSRLPREVRGQPSTPHRILLGSLILAAKYLNDSSFKNKDWATCSIISTPAFHFGFGLTDVNLMERELLSLLDWDLRITENDLYQVLDHFLCPIRADIQTRYIRALTGKGRCQQLQPESNPRFWQPLTQPQAGRWRAPEQHFFYANDHTITTTATTLPSLPCSPCICWYETTEGTYPMMRSDTHPQPPCPSASSTTILQAATVVLRPQPIAAAPTTASGWVPAILCPVPVGGLMSQLEMNFPYGQNRLILQTSMVPTHAAGSQGRGGILPGALDTSVRPSAGKAQEVDWVPQKVVDGRFPCPHCTKTYLRAKHLKRHLLRRKSRLLSFVAQQGGVT